MMLGLHGISQYNVNPIFWRLDEQSDQGLQGLQFSLHLFEELLYGRTNVKLDLMFMKHYAPNRCLYIKVAKLRTGVGSAETSYLQNCSVNSSKSTSKSKSAMGDYLEKKIK